MNFEPFEALVTQRLAVGEENDAACHVTTQMVEVRRHGIHAATKVQIVRKPEGLVSKLEHHPHVSLSTVDQGKDLRDWQSKAGRVRSTRGSRFPLCAFVRWLHSSLVVCVRRATSPRSTGLHFQYFRDDGYLFHGKWLFDVRRFDRDGHGELPAASASKQIDEQVEHVRVDLPGAAVENVDRVE